MARLGQISVFVVMGAIGLIIAGWAGYACVTMKPETYTVMRESDDGIRLVCTIHTTVDSYFRRVSLVLGTLVGGVIVFIAVSSLRELRKR